MAARVFQGPSDLHLHSQRSDGTEPPAEVMAAARRHGVRTASLTDHDTTDGWGEAAVAATELGMTFLPGIEVSAKHAGRSVHLLAYLTDPGEPALRAELERIRQSRLTRARTMVERIGRDHPLVWADVLERAPDGATVGRPHIADALVRHGLVADRAAAFAGILSHRSDYYVALYAPTPLNAVRLVVAAGGVAVIAHPAGRAGLLPAAVLEELFAAGLAGFELGHRENLPDGRRAIERLARAHDLILTGSSDYHGTGKPNLPGEHTTADDMVARIIERGTGSAPVYP